MFHVKRRSTTPRQGTRVSLVWAFGVPCHLSTMSGRHVSRETNAASHSRVAPGSSSVAESVAVNPVALNPLAIWAPSPLVETVETAMFHVKQRGCRQTVGLCVTSVVTASVVTASVGIAP